MDYAAFLDNDSNITKLDPKGMYGLTAGFPAQVQRAVEIAKAEFLPQAAAAPSFVVLTGMGGSAAGGDFVRALFEAYGKFPFFVNRDYTLPNYINSETLMFACSYSGNTEETLAAYAQAEAAGSRIIVTSSGGKITEAAKHDGYLTVEIPGGQPPRTALGLLLMPVIYGCEVLSLLPAQDYDALVKHLEDGTAKWGKEVPFANNPAKQLAAKLHGKVAVIYGLGSWQGLVANRWKGQIAENSKVHTFHNTYPELCHNEILGWVKSNTQGVNKWAMIRLEDGTESAKMKKRAEVVERLTPEVEHHIVQADGNTLLEKMLSLAMYGDFVSIYLAALNGVDPENIDSINTLKDELSSIQ